MNFVVGHFIRIYHLYQEEAAICAVVRCFVEGGTSSASQDVHAPAANLTELRKTVALREKMEAMREKRRVNTLLGSVCMELTCSFSLNLSRYVGHYYE